MAGIQIGGIASGLDTESIITQLMSIESAPRTRTARQQVTVQARQDALRQIDTKLTNLKLAAGDLRSASIWTPTQAISSGNESVLTARQLTGAAPGGYTVNVASLASADSRTYQWNGGGDLTVAYKTDGSAQSKTFNLAGMSLDDAVSTINSDDGSPVWAVNVGGKLSLSRRDTGDHANWGFDASGPAIGAMTASRDGANASYTVAGDATVYSSHTNVASDGLPGVEMTFKSTGTSTVTVSTPSAKSDDVAAKLKAFVSAYNDAVDLVRSKLTEKRVVNPQSDDDAKQGALYGDDTLDSVLTSMRQAISTAGLDSLGVSVASTGSGTSPDALDGKLTFDQATFDTAWTTSPAAVKAKLGSQDAPGFAQSFEGLLDPITRAGDGLIDQRVSDADSELSYIKDSLATMDLRLQTKEDLLRKQFTAMEQAIAASQSASSSLAGQLAQLGNG
ncbi:MAG TPA: flagellar filament capping protein FliD [Solirubrobacteraceae bacterium]|nr:flagellar filament capping protein FliD [Solirubrobacteraceae bacterium]